MKIVLWLWSSESFANEAPKFFASEVSKSFAEEVFSIAVIKGSLINVVNISVGLFIIKYSMNFDFEVDIDYGFRRWTHVKVDISLFEKALSEKGCFDIGAGSALIDRKFFEAQASNVLIRIMITFITVRDLNTDKYTINEYVIVFMIFIEKDDKSNDARAMFRREIHIMNNLKINILMGNEIMGPEEIFVDFGNGTARINNCRIIVFIEVRIFSKAISKSIHLRKTIIIFSRSELPILMLSSNESRIHSNHSSH